MVNRAAEILLVEDDPGDVDLMIEILKRGNIEHNLKVVDDGVKALEYIGTNGDHNSAARPDLIILDLNLPKKDGRSVLNEVKTHSLWKSIPVIIFTTSKADSDISRSYFAGANCYITKPTEFAKFSATVEALKGFWFSTVTLPSGASFPAKHVPKKSPVNEEKIGIRVLLVEDEASDADFLINSVGNETKQHFIVQHVTSHHEAIGQIIQSQVDVILLDLNLSETKGIETFDKLLPHTSNIPIVTMICLDEQDLAHEVIRKGAQDYIIKGFSEHKTYPRIIQYAIERKKNEIKMAQMEFYDSLTNLPNRTLFNDHLKHLILHSQRQNQSFALFFLDLDHFKLINDTLGHPIGDALLRLVSERLLRSLRNSDTLSRIGGDEFSIIIPIAENGEKDIEKVASKIHKSLLEPFVLDDQKIFISASSGICIFPQHGDDAQTLSRHADSALFSAKKEGRNRFCIYKESLEKNNVQRFSIHGDLIRAVQNHEFELFYQPRMDTLTNKITGAESLIRWNHPKLGLVLPSEFIPIAEEDGIIVEIGKWVLKNAFQQVSYWKKCTAGGNFTVSINASSRQFKGSSLRKTIAKILKTTGIEPHLIELELTETQLFDDLKVLAKDILELNDMGVKIVLDDFGTGYAGMSYIKELPLSAIKIDQSYIRRIVTRQEEQKIVRSMINLAHEIGIRVIAEGVEDAEQLEILKKYGCDEIQGYFLSVPINSSAFTKKYFPPIPSITEDTIFQSFA